jgi:hypothetical protein
VAPYVKFESSRELLTSVGRSAVTPARSKIEFQMARALENRLGELKGGRLAMVNQGTQAGDRLCLLRGCPAPVILRQGVGGRAHYVFVGTCHVAGWDCVAERDAVDGRPGDVKRFEIH